MRVYSPLPDARGIPRAEEINIWSIQPTSADAADFFMSASPFSDSQKSFTPSISCPSLISRVMASSTSSFGVSPEPVNSARETSLRAR